MQASGQLTIADLELNARRIDGLQLLKQDHKGEA